MDIKKIGVRKQPPDSENRNQAERRTKMKDVIVEMFLALAAVNVATKQFSCYPY